MTINRANQTWPEDVMKYYYSGSGRIQLEMTLEQAVSASHQGQCDNDVLALSTVPSIQSQLSTIDANDLRSELKEYGAWDATELADHDQNLQRLLWLAAGDIVEESRSEPQDEFERRQRGSASTIAALFVVALFAVCAIAVFPMIAALANVAK